MGQILCFQVKIVNAKKLFKVLSLISFDSEQPTWRRAWEDISRESIPSL